ncbi:MAG: ABC transporter permease [Flavobacteriales bacterium]|jgi:putative ABC transport system permease protein|nr:ABC transporter permease [Bacteroidota bacterium]MDP4952541.1 ABC transporter permease [Flavobacteriales bacterium]
MIYFRLLRESFLFAWQAITNNKLRTLLSLLGVMVGIFVISSVFTMVDTMESNLKDSFNMLSDDVLFVQKMPWGPEDGETYEWWKYFQRRQPKLKDVVALEQRLSLAEAVSFQTGTMATFEYRNSSAENMQLAAVTVAYPKCVQIDIEEGRFFTEREAQTGRPVAIIGADMKAQLFGEADALGKSIKVKGRKMEVIGVFKKAGVSIVSDGFDQMAMTNANFGSRLMNFQKTDCSMVVKAKDGVDVDELKEEIVQHYRTIRGVKPSEDNDFAINRVEMITSVIDEIFIYVERGGWFIGLFAILVGCVSIANIMFVSVRERTRIIGIQKALGAKDIFILGQFLFEAIALCVFGAIMAFLLVVIMVLVVNALSARLDWGLELGIHLNRFFIAMLIAIVSGLVAGIFPALKAARMSPVEAMRG